MTTETAKTKAVSIFNVNNYAALAPEASNDFKDAMLANIDGDDITARQLFGLIKVPGSAGTTWSIPSFEDDDLSEKVITGIILFIGHEKVMYEGKYGEGDSVPLCTSANGVIGVGRPGGECASCPNNEYGSALQGKGKACSDQKPIYVLLKGLEDQAMPNILRCPPTSFKALKNYRIGLTRRGIQMHLIETKFSLKKVSNSNNVDYSEIVFSPGQRITDSETKEKIKRYKEELLPFVDPNFSHKIEETEAA